MRHLKIVMAVIEQNGTFHLQYRNGDKKIGAAGLVGCFGGKIEQNESNLEAVCREVAEETNLTPIIDDMHNIGKVDVMSDNNLKPVAIEGHIFRYMIDKNVIVQAKEGILMSYTLDQVRENLDKMTSGTKACFIDLIGVI